MNAAPEQIWVNSWNPSVFADGCLKAVWTLYLVEFGVQWAAELHVLHKVRALALVWRNDADLVRFGSSLQQTGGDLLHISSLSPEYRQMIFFNETRPLNELHLTLVRIVSEQAHEKYRIWLYYGERTRRFIVYLILTEYGISFKYSIRWKLKNLASDFQKRHKV